MAFGKNDGSSSEKQFESFDQGHTSVETVSWPGTESFNDYSVSKAAGVAYASHFTLATRYGPFSGTPTLTARRQNTLNASSYLAWILVPESVGGDATATATTATVTVTYPAQQEDVTENQAAVTAASTAVDAVAAETVFATAQTATVAVTYPAQQEDVTENQTAVTTTATAVDPDVAVTAIAAPSSVSVTYPAQQENVTENQTAVTVTSTAVDAVVSVTEDQAAVTVASTAVDAVASSSTTLELESFRWRDDTAIESADSGWLANQNTNISAQINDTIRLRVLIDAVGDPASAQYKLQYRKTGEGTWLDVGP